MRQKHFTPSQGVDLLLERLANVHPAGSGRWRASCPAHGSGKNQTLSIAAQGEKVLIHCFAGCPADRVLGAIGLTWAGLHRGNPRPWETPSGPDPRPTRPDGDNARRWQEWWDSATPKHPLLKTYLRARGLHLTPPPTLRLALWPEPVMLARVVDGAGRLVGMHLTFLEPDGSGRREKRLAKGSKPLGGAIRLIDSPRSTLERTPLLALTEGIETALAIHQETGWPVWACVSAGGLAAVELPPKTREVVICADHDPAGLEAANKLARRLLAKGRKVRVATPPEPGQDWLDVVAAEVTA